MRIDSLSLISTGTEMICYRGQFDSHTGWADWVKYPFAPGYSNVARVVKVGANVVDFKEGDRVFSGAGHSEFATLRADPAEVIKLPAASDEEDAAWSAVTFITQTGVRRAEHAMGDTAVVIGLGPLGQHVVQYLRLLGLREIIAIDTVRSRLDLARNHGATAVFEGSAGDAADLVKERTDDNLADVVYDVTGHFAVFPMALGLARRAGKVILIGDTPHPSKQHLTHDLINKQLTIMGTHGASLPPALADWTKRRQILLFLDYVNRGQMKMKDMITHRFTPREAAKAYAFLDQDRSGSMGVLFDWRTR